METPGKIKVKILKASPSYWYNVGEIHEVFNYISFILWDDPYFKSIDGNKWIDLADCMVISQHEIPEYTMKEAIEKMGHDFKIIE